MATNGLSVAELQALLKVAKQIEKDAKRTDETSNGLYLRVSKKAAVSVYGLGRWPVTLYASQMEQLLAASDDIRTFIAANPDKLKRKETAEDVLTENAPVEQQETVTQ